MKREEIKELENRVKLYYKNKKTIEKLKDRVIKLDRHTGDILREMRELRNFKAEICSNMGIDYSKELIQISSPPGSEVEKELYKYIENLRNDCFINKRRKIKTEKRIRDFEYINQDLEFAINQLTEEEKRFLELKYGEGKSIEYIALNLFTGARSTTYRRREEIIRKISEII
ncbi:hypothetical protein KLF37_07185 [Clostridium perfringens]|uniref:hypothetical protein n=1 Tax=Clostridium perfringens TaxID=1502 RepID=UPI001CCB02F2|nr:hypothetical protein [Clostridium perfringens]UBK93102.1 hypothetical protein KLF37_07185 [Clostridium perfringens]